jgi:hypothetical protein
MANPLQRVLLWGTQNKYTTTEAGATKGADLGINIYYNGVLLRPEDILNLTPTEESQFPITLWRNILEIPPNVTALAETNTTGLYVITGPGGSVTRTLISGPGVDWINGDGVAGNPQPVFNSNTAPVDRIVGSTYSTVQDFVDTMHSPGIILGGEITDIGSGNVRIMAGSMMIRTADDDVSPLPFANFAQADFAVPNDQLTRFFGVVYNAGAPIVEMRTTYNWNKDTEIPLGSAVRLSTTITNVTPNKYRMGDPITNVIQRFDAQSPAIRDNSIGGLLIGETGVRNVTVTAGKIWSRLSDFDSAAKNSSVNTMLSVFFNGVNLTVTSGVTQWDNMNFNTGGALVVMGNNKWANLWFFISIDGTKYGYAYGTGEHNSLGAAANEGLPFYLNQNFFNQTLLLGRFVFQKGAATAGLIESAFTSIFNTASVNNHNDLAGLQGGAIGEYYHLTALQNADVTTLSTGGTNAQFWRGDKVYSNELEGPFSARALVDTATLGAELTTNGTFTGSAAGWTLGAGWAYSANNVVLTNPGAGTLSQNITVTAGVPYLVTWTQQHSVANNVILTPSIGAVSGVSSTYSLNTLQTQTQVITPVASGAIALTFTPTAGTVGTLTIDSVSVVAISAIPFTLELENVAGSTAVEHRGLASNTNLSIGSLSAIANTTGTGNTFIGGSAGRSNTTGGMNTFLGNAAGLNNTTGANNMFIGQTAGFRNTTGNTNVFLGVEAGARTTTGSNNGFYGMQSGDFNIAGSNNVFLGHRAGRLQADGVTPLTDPEGCVYIGRDTLGLNNSDSNSIVVGLTAIGRGANTAVWGNTSILNHYFSGNVNVNTSSIVHLGAGVIGLGNATTVPSVNPVGGGVMYAEAGAGKWRGSGGTITTFGPADPHCPICSSDFVHEWENPKYGYLAVCMNCHCDGINSHTRIKGEWSTHKE